MIVCIEVAEDGSVQVGSGESMDAVEMAPADSVEAAISVAEDLLGNQEQVEDAMEEPPEEMVDAEAVPEDAMTDKQYWNKSAKGRAAPTATGGM